MTTKYVPLAAESVENRYVPVQSQPMTATAPNDPRDPREPPRTPPDQRQPDPPVEDPQAPRPPQGDPAPDEPPVRDPDPDRQRKRVSTDEVFPTDDIDAVVDVLADAFSGYPVMRFTVGTAGDVATRQRRLVQLFVTRRVVRGGPMYAVTAPGASGFAGAILLTLPGEPESSPAAAHISVEAWRELGDDARLRYEEFAAAADFFRDYPPHLHLNMIGIRHAYKGRGLGRMLLEKVSALAKAEPAWAGISLTTENPRNVDLYRRFGYDVVGEGRFGSLTTWGMYRRLR